MEKPVEHFPRLVEPGESLPTHMLVERMMDAGVRLSVQHALEHLYEFGATEEIPEGYIGPGGYYSTDIVDVANLKKWLEARIRGELEEADRLAKEALDAKNAKSEPEPGPPGPVQDPPPVDDPPA
jgi:hypothetical protein